MERAKVKKRGLFLGKKAQAQHEILFTIFEVLVFAFFTYLLFAFVNDVEDNTTFEKNFIARDLAVMVNTVYTSPSSIVYNYPEDKKDFVVKVQNNMILVKNQGQDDAVGIKYWFAVESPDNPVMEEEYSTGDNIKLNKSLVTYSGEEAYYSGISTSGSWALEADSECGDAIVSIARQATGHPYCLGLNWDPSKLPPTEPNCDKTGILCSNEQWRSGIQRTGGKCPIDCSAFTKWVYNYYSQHGGGSKYQISVDWAEWQAKNVGGIVDHDPMKGDYISTKPDFSKLQKGDLVFFAKTVENPHYITHVGIYVGGNKFIHAGDPINEAKLASSYWQEKYAGARRLC